MLSSNQNLLMLFNRKTISEGELNSLNGMLLSADNPEQFCTAHELVNRNRITSSKEKIVKESRRLLLRPFRFLINKN
ncbi:MAG: hypothetical protein HZB42_10840 [Sphingobacteriales bacterium]|nr:hypothetical protein [Sphingobacteriales bacterium]